MKQNPYLLQIHTIITATLNYLQQLLHTSKVQLLLLQKETEKNRKEKDNIMTVKQTESQTDRKTDGQTVSKVRL